MTMFSREFSIRWDDIDANGHLAHVAYSNYAVQTRMELLKAVGLNWQNLAKLKMGPIIFSEHLYYFKEVFPDETLLVVIELDGLSEDGMFFEFNQDFYNSKKQNVARCQTLGSWLDHPSRSLTTPPKEIVAMFAGTIEKTANFKVLTKEDTRKWNQAPKPLKE